MHPTLAVLNGSLGGDQGNTGAILRALTHELDSRARLVHIDLNSPPPPAELHRLLTEAHGFVFATGTYWDCWGSPLQRFLETATDLEASDVWLGKPAAVVVTMHAVGGKGCSRGCRACCARWACSCRR